MTQVGREGASPFLPSCLPLLFDLPRPFADPEDGADGEGCCGLVDNLGLGCSSDAISDRKCVTS